MIVLILLLVCTLAGCSQTAEYLIQRDAQGCYHVEGHVRSYLSAKGMIATGGASLEDCIKWLWP